jgi:HK97 gp10 family phage protein
MVVRQKGPRSAVHRGPGKSYRQRWRHPFIHALDTIKVSRLKAAKATGNPYVVVGPGRGDNTPSFYLKFHEYGTKENPGGHPFIRPAREQVMRTQAAGILQSAIEQYVDKQKGAPLHG